VIQGLPPLNHGIAVQLAIILVGRSRAGRLRFELGGFNRLRIRVKRCGQLGVAEKLLNRQRPCPG
jgi:hypothetical protein